MATLRLGTKKSVGGGWLFFDAMFFFVFALSCSTLLFLRCLLYAACRTLLVVRKLCAVLFCSSFSLCWFRPHIHGMLVCVSMSWLLLRSIF